MPIIMYFVRKNCNDFCPDEQEKKKDLPRSFPLLWRKKYDITPIVRKWLKFYIGFLGLGQKCEEPIIISGDILEPFFGVYNFLFLTKKKRKIRHEDNILGNPSSDVSDA